MNAVIDHSQQTPAIAEMGQVLQRQRTAFNRQLPVSAECRRERLDKCISLLVDNQDALCQAMAEDFGQRPALMSKFVDIASAINELKHARSQLKKWMKPRRKPVRFPLGLLGARAWIEQQPVGVVGIIAPWNFPVNLTFGPLAGALAAGNRCMIKPSEFTPATSALMAELIDKHFSPEEVWVATGDAEIGKAFSELPFDHLFFTGSTSVGRHVMQAAAHNLTPVTLELGGKSPAVFAESADMERAVDRLVIGKQMNAGQVCLAPDYVFVPEHQLDSFIARVSASCAKLFPNSAHHVDSTAIVSDRHYQRLKDMLDEASAAGCQISGETANDANRILPLTLVVNPDDQLKVMREEIFGPILPIKTYQSIDQVIEYINSHDRPLGLYYFGSKDGGRQLLDQTISGGVTLDDVIFHVSVAELPFGGVGASGIGAYHGEHGFHAFSHSKAVFRQARVNVAKLIGFIPPYGKKLERTLKMDIRK